MNDYQSEQWDTLNTALRAIAQLDRLEREALKEELRPYIDYRRKADLFLSAHFGPHCTQSCYENHLSACCSKDGIITFWADTVINALLSDQAEIADCARALSEPTYAHKCTYLGSMGCRWRMRPLMCAMFLCDSVISRVLIGNSELQGTWKTLRKAADDFRWPDKPVLFDRLETFFMHKGVHSPLMYINKTPGLLRIKQKAGLHHF
jgi:hypothetical protein